MRTIVILVLAAANVLMVGAGAASADTRQGMFSDCTTTRCW